MPFDDAQIDKIRAAYDQCFGCGQANAMGLRLDGFAPDGDDGIATTFTPRAEYGGFAGVLHGGIIATALDETLAWTAMLVANALVVTATLEVKYRNPAEPGRPLRVSGRIVERSGRRLRLAGAVTEDDVVVAEATGLFLVTGDVGAAL